MDFAFKEKAQSDPFAASQMIVDEAIDSHVDPTDTFDLPNPRSKYKTANILPQAVRPNHAKNIKFDLNLDALLEDFIHA